MSSKRHLLSPKTVVLGEWLIIRRIGSGTFSEIYEAGHVDTEDLVAIKVEKKANSSLVQLDTEHEFLEQLQGSPWIPRVINYGEEDGRKYLIMQRLGDNLSSLRRMRQGRRFTFKTSVIAAIKMLDALQSIHELGIVHRDVKPSNCLIGLDDQEVKLFMVDFGLAKKHFDDQGRILPASTQTSFFGTSLYASVAAHEHKDLGRKDDLWSIWFMLVDLVRPDLPWRSERKLDRHEVYRLKTAALLDVDELLRGVRGNKQLKAFAHELKALEYDSKPDYANLRGILVDMLGSKEEVDVAALDWVREGYYRRVQTREKEEAEEFLRQPDVAERRREAARQLLRARAATTARATSTAIRLAPWPEDDEDFLTSWVTLAGVTVDVQQEMDRGAIRHLCKLLAQKTFFLDPAFLTTAWRADTVAQAHRLLATLEPLTRGASLWRKRQHTLGAATPVAASAGAEREAPPAKRARA